MTLYVCSPVRISEVPGVDTGRPRGVSRPGRPGPGAPGEEAESRSWTLRRTRVALRERERQVGLTHGPSTARSLQSSSSKTDVDQSEWRARDEDDGGRERDEGGGGRMEHPRFPSTVVEGMAKAEVIADRVGVARQDHGDARRRARSRRGRREDRRRLRRQGRVRREAERDAQIAGWVDARPERVQELLGHPLLG